MTMRLMILASAGLLALSACSGGHKDEEILTENGTEETNVAAPDMNLVAPPPVVVENATNVATPAPPPAFSDEQQMRDDADASGLTSRLPDETTQPVQGGNETR